MASSGKPVLYGYYRSSCTWRVRIALAWKGIPYEHHYVNLVKNEQLGDDYQKINAKGAVPSLYIDGHYLTQSGAILEYLEETHPEHPLLPPVSSPMLRAQAREIMNLINCDIQPVQNLSVMKAVGASDDEKKGEWARKWIQKGFDALEPIVKRTAGKYSVGDNVTLADLSLAPMVYGARRWQLDMTPYPTINKIEANLSTLDAFKAAHAHMQDDCPQELRGVDVVSAHAA